MVTVNTVTTSTATADMDMDMDMVTTMGERTRRKHRKIKQNKFKKVIRCLMILLFVRRKYNLARLDGHVICNCLTTSNAS